MSERHSIIGKVRGDPLPAGRVGIRLHVRLSGSPSGRWSRDLGARLTNELTGEPSIGYLSVNDIVQGNQIVLDGVEERAARNLATALHRAVDATNDACEEPDRPAGANMPRRKANAIATEALSNDRPHP
jgi:hypothetical protein